jgi:DNA-binding transcriptional regulator YhcF (GntR family)
VPTDCPTVLSDVVRIDRTRVEPPVQQIFSSIAQAVQEGILPPGTRLPTVRALATEAGVAVNTVAKSFRRLSDEGIVISRGRGGTVIAPRDTVLDRVSVAAQEYASFATGLGLDAESAVSAVRSVLEATAATGNVGAPAESG